MKEPLLDEVVEGPCVAPGFLPFFGHHLGPLLDITLRHHNSRKVSSSALRFEGDEEDGGLTMICNCWVKIKDMTLCFYNNSFASSTSRILGKWANPAADAAFRFSIITVS